MIGLEQQTAELIGLMLLGVFLIWIMSGLGSYFERLIGSTDNLIVRLTGGLLISVILFSIIFFKGKTMFAPAGILLAIGLIMSKINPILKIKISNIENYIPALFFFIVFIFRVFIMYRPETGLFDSFLSDDYIYASTLSYMFYTGEENMEFVIGKKLTVISTGYYTYHYFTFATGLLVKCITNFNTNLIFHFFLIPFFQSFGLTGLYSIAKISKKTTLISIILSLLTFSSLRYNTWDDMIIKYIPIIQDGFWFKNFFGQQLLFSGFSIKLCISLGVISLIITNLNSIKLLANSVYLIFINPLFILISGFCQLLVLVLKKRIYLISIITPIIAFMIFGYLMKSNSPHINLNYALSYFDSIFILGPKNWFSYAIGEFINDQLNYFIIPLIITLSNSKSTQYRLAAGLIIAIPFLEPILSSKPILWSVFLLIVFCVGVYIVYKNRKNTILLFLSCSVAITTGTYRFSFVLPELD